MLIISACVDVNTYVADACIWKYLTVKTQPIPMQPPPQKKKKKNQNPIFTIKTLPPSLQIFIHPQLDSIWNHTHLWI